MLSPHRPQAHCPCLSTARVLSGVLPHSLAMVGVTGMLTSPFFSPVSHRPGDVLFQMAEVHRQIQNQLEEMVRPSPRGGPRAAGPAGTGGPGGLAFGLLSSTPPGTSWLCGALLSPQGHRLWIRRAPHPGSGRLCPGGTPPTPPFPGTPQPLTVALTLAHVPYLRS